jgi:hypothetical protein
MGTVGHRVVERSWSWSGEALGQACPAAVSSDGEEPRLEFAFEIKTMQTLDHAQKRLLSRVLGVLPVPKHPEAESKYAILELVNQLAQRDRVPRQAVAKHQAKFSLQDWALTCTYYLTGKPAEKFQEIGTIFPESANSGDFPSPAVSEMVPPRLRGPRLPIRCSRSRLEDFLRIGIQKAKRASAK